jgi:hypothetical protein
LNFSQLLAHIPKEKASEIAGSRARLLDAIAFAATE